MSSLRVPDATASDPATPPRFAVLPALQAARLTSAALHAIVQGLEWQRAQAAARKTQLEQLREENQRMLDGSPGEDTLCGS